MTVLEAQKELEAHLFGYVLDLVCAVLSRNSRFELHSPFLYVYGWSLARRITYFSKNDAKTRISRKSVKPVPCHIHCFTVHVGVFLDIVFVQCDHGAPYIELFGKVWYTESRVATLLLKKYGTRFRYSFLVGRWPLETACPEWENHRFEIYSISATEK